MDGQQIQNKSYVMCTRGSMIWDERDVELPSHWGGSDRTEIDEHVSESDTPQG